MWLYLLPCMSLQADLNYTVLHPLCYLCSETVKLDKAQTTLKEHTSKFDVAAS